MRKFLLILLLLFPFSAFGAGNETINVLPDSNKATFRVDSQNFWKNELPNILHRYVKNDFVYSGGLHGTSSGCVSDPFSLEAFTNKGNRITADGAGGATSINYGAANIGGNCASDVCWVAGSSSDAATLPGTNFQRSGNSNLYVDCVSPGISSWPDDTAKLMRVTLNGGAISAVQNLQGMFALSSNIVCDGITDASIAIQTALDEAPLGSTIVLPPGVCLLSQTINVNRPLGLKGAGMERTFLRQTVSNIPVINVSSYTVDVKKLTVNHSGNAIAGGDGIVVRGPGGIPLFAVTIMEVGANYNFRGFVLGAMAYSQAAHLWAMRNNSHGFEFLYEAAGGGTLQWDILLAISQQNLGAGYFGQNVASSNGIGPWLTQSGSFANNGGGFVFHGSPGFPISAIRFSIVGASTDNIVGIYLNTFGGSHTIVMPSVENVGLNAGIPQGSAGTLSVASNTGHGIEITVNNNYGVMINGGTFWNNSWSGVLLGAPFSQLIGGQTIGNGKAFAPEPHKRAGVYISADNVQVSNHTFQFVGDGSTLEYIGIYPLVTGTIIGPNTFAPGLPAIPMMGPGGGGSTASITCDGVTPVSSQIQALLDTVPLGSTIVLPPGICILNQTLNITRTLVLEGAGITHTTFRQTIPNIPVIFVGAVNELGLREFTVDHTGNPVAGGDGIVFSQIMNNARMDNVAAMRNWRGFALSCVAYGSISHLETSFNNLHGIEFVYGDCGTMQWQVHHSISTQNKGAGYFGSNTAATNGIGPFLNDAGSFGNDLGGFLFIGSPGHPINDLFLIGAYSSADNNNGIYLNTYGGSHVLTNLWAELTGALGGWPVGTDGTIMNPSHTGACVSVTVNNARGLVITGGYYWNCSWANVSLEAPYSSLIGGGSIGAGLALDPDPYRRANIYIGSDAITVSGHTFNYNASGALSYMYLNGVFTDLPIGTNTYDPAIGVQNYIKVSPTSSFSGAISPRMVTGVNVYSGVPEAAGLTITDMGPGAPTPAKALRVASGGLEILNYTYTGVLHRLSDEGTPSWPQRSGQVTITGATNVGSVSLSPIEPDSNYSVQVTVSGSSAAPIGALTVAGVNKNPAAFDIITAIAPGVGASVTFNWVVHR